MLLDKGILVCLPTFSWLMVNVGKYAIYIYSSIGLSTKSYPPSFFFFGWTKKSSRFAIRPWKSGNLPGPDLGGRPRRKNRRRNRPRSPEKSGRSWPSRRTVLVVPETKIFPLKIHGLFRLFPINRWDRWYIITQIGKDYKWYISGYPPKNGGFQVRNFLFHGSMF